MKNRARIIGTMMLTFIVTSEVQAQVSRRSTTIGIHAAFDVSDGRVESERVGIQAHLPIARSFELVPQFSYFLSTSGWRANLTARVRPRVLGSLLSIGSGVSISEFDLVCAQPGCDGFTRTIRALAVVAIDVQRWSLGPFGELHLLNILGNHVNADVVLGIKTRI